MVARLGEGVVLKFSGTQATGWTEPSTCNRRAGWNLVDARAADPRPPHGRRAAGAGRRWTRRGGWTRLQPSADAVGSQVHEVSLADAFQLSATVWPWIFVVSGVLVAAGAVLTMITAGTWPSRSDRFRAGVEQVGGSRLRRSSRAVEGNGCGGRSNHRSERRHGSRCHTPMCTIATAGDTMDDTDGRRARRNARSSGVPGRYVLGMQIPISGNEGTMAGTAQHSDLTHPTKQARQARTPWPHTRSLDRLGHRSDCVHCRRDRRGHPELAAVLGIGGLGRCGPDCDGSPATHGLRGTLIGPIVGALEDIIAGVREDLAVQQPEFHWTD